MERKFLVAFLLLLTVLVIGGIWLIVDDDENGPIPLPREEETSPIVKALEERPADLPSKEGERELLAPLAEKPAVEDTVMPASFREALGGFVGRVLEEDGTPVEGMAVEIYGAGFKDVLCEASAYMEGDSPFFRPKVVGTKTAKDGRFHLQGAYPLSFYVLSIDGGGTRSLARIIDHLPGPKETVDLGDILLPPASVLTGRVVDGRGDPVPGVRIRAVNLPPMVFLSGVQEYRPGGSFLVDMGRSTGKTVFDAPPLFDTLVGKLPIPKTLAGSDGVFRLEGVPPGPISVVLDKEGLVSTVHGPVSTSKTGEKDLGDLEIKEGTLLQGKVVDPAGRPLAGVKVRAGSIHSFKEFIVLASQRTTDGGGAFSQPGIANFSAMVAARRHDLDPWTVCGPFNPASGPAVITLSDAFDVTLHFMDEEKAPVPDVALKIRASRGREDLILFNPHLPPGDRLKRPTPGTVMLKDLAPGKYEVLAWAKGMALESISLHVEDAPLEKEILLQESQAVPIRVLTQEGEAPVEWAEVYTWTNGSDFFLNPTRISRSRTDKNGTAVLENLRPGKYQVTASHPRYAVASKEMKVPADEEVVFLLQEGGILEGTVYPGGSGTFPPYLLALTPSFGRDGIEAMTPRLTTTGADGLFRVINLTPGSWRINILRTLFDKDPAGLLEMTNQRELHRYRTEVEAGTTTYVEITIGSEDRGPSSTISGKVFLDGVPVKGARVYTWAEGKSEATTDGKGGYRLEHVAAGNRSITLTLPIYPPQTNGISLVQQVKVEDKIPLYEDFYIITGSLSGRIVDQETGTSCQGVFTLTLRSTGEDSPYSLRTIQATREDGSFTFEKIPIGVYTITTNDSNLRFEPVTGIKILPGMETGPITIQHSPPLLVEGRVDLPGGQSGEQWAFLYFQPQNEASRDGKSTKVSVEDGTFSIGSLPPGSYRVYFYSDQGLRQEPILLDVPAQGLTGLVLTFDKE